jgi:predicted RNase H-like HicB family nuclease
MRDVPLCVETAVTTAALTRFEVRVVGSMRRDEDADVFVSHIPVLRLYSQGHTEEDARHAIEQAVRLCIKTAVECGRLSRILQRPGFAQPGHPSTAGQYIRLVDDRRRPRAETRAAAVAGTAAPS